VRIVQIQKGITRATQLQDPAMAARFEHAGEAWDVALQIAALRQQAD
jgi:hypothetical protein